MSKIPKHILWVLGAVLLLGGCGKGPAVPVTTLPTTNITIGGAPLEVEVANTEKTLEQGLSGRVSLPEGRGMLFTFEQPAPYEFWMYEMKFPLDFLWLADGTVVNVNENVPPPTPASPEPARVRPQKPVTGVIEVPAGWISRHGVKVGDIVQGLP